MNQVKCPICFGNSIKYGKNTAGTQRWQCKKCRIVFVNQIDSRFKDLNTFLDWLFSKETQKKMTGEGRTFRHKTRQFWDIWPMPPKIEDTRDVLYVDGIYLARNACILTCCDDKHVLGWYLCRYEHSGAWRALMHRIAAPRIVLSDGGTGFGKALKGEWRKSKHQRCIFHVFCQIRRYTTTNPKTKAGFELYQLGKDLLNIVDKEESKKWIKRLFEWDLRYKSFLEEKTRDANGTYRPTHERLIKAKNSVFKLLNENALFLYLDEELNKDMEIASTTNRIEGSVNSRLREMLREHRGLRIDRRIKAVFWWCYQHSPNPLSASEILKVMPTDKSISELYNKMDDRNKLEGTIQKWGDSVVWSDLHKTTITQNDWD